MSAKIIDGKFLAGKVRDRLAREIKEMAAQGLVPGLAVILAGNDPASLSYVTLKERDCAKVGIYSRDIRLDAHVKEKDFLALIEELNADPAIHGILIQLPLPPHLDKRRLLQKVDPAKDVDGFHSQNAGNLVLGLPGFVPCTPLAVLELLQETGIPLEGRRAVVLGRSHLVGSPLANLLYQKAPGRNATVTVCHSYTQSLAEETRRADILIAAAGKPRLITKDMVKPGAAVIDVGISRVETPGSGASRLTGDVVFHEVKEVAGFLTPVPGGVGPLTRAMLLGNTLIAAQRQFGYNT